LLGIVVDFVDPASLEIDNKHVNIAGVIAMVILEERIKRPLAL
jgi:hypothetical protein